MQEFRYLIAVQLFMRLCQKKKSIKKAGRARAVWPHGVAQGKEGCIGNHLYSPSVIRKIRICNGHSCAKSLFPSSLHRSRKDMQIMYIPPLVSACWKQGQHWSSSQFTSWQQQGFPEYFSSRQTQQDALRQQRYNCFPSEQTVLLRGGFHPSSSGELVLNHTDAAEHNSPGTGKLLHSTAEQ